MLLFNMDDNGGHYVVSFQEEGYVEYLRVKRVHVQERELSEDASDVVPQVSRIHYVAIIIFIIIISNKKIVTETESSKTTSSHHHHP